MKRAIVLVPLLFAAGLLAACDAGTPPCGASGAVNTLSCEPPAERKVNAEVAEFVPDTAEGPFPAARDDVPIDVALLRGWNTGSSGGDTEPRDPATAFTMEDTPAVDYVAVSANTGCRLAEGAELYLRGSDLRVRFTGGLDRPECARSYTAYAQFAVPATEIAAVSTIEGEDPANTAGPGTLTDFVAIGVLDGDTGGLAPVRLGDGRGAELYEELIAAGAGESPKLREALRDESPDGTTAVAFVLSGCAEDGAKLVVTPAVVSAELTGGERTACESESWFAATFAVGNAYLPGDARLAVFGRE
ncbi:hypothetical protein [Phytomonospora endophytica]|uniref:Lipoprotein n=1 Tax=Phytomonospora endophytica TaxID=714109 RepID=A0A841FN19_9ACTN|nr:hypothetical protein [Phytomonospora endophytica]MBB6034617.1 hypothetical protein [Phytomonospora endophytica]GIG71323.1 hypothetical protein Pen01_76180 [Phytomonospora endophytica]